MQLRFTKMHGAGNDFVMIDGVRQQVTLKANTLRKLADRRFGVGADQVLLVQAPDEPGIDFCYRIFNADGNEVEQCGNGARCFVRFVREQGLTDKRSIRVKTVCGIIEPSELDDGRVRVDMGPPDFAPETVGFDTGTLVSRLKGQITQWGLPIDDQVRWIAVASMGNPHAVQLVDDVDAAPVLQEGESIEKHVRFANGVNAGYLQIRDRHHLRLRVFERGVGETLACGTGACAAGALAMHMDLADSPVQIEARGGFLQIDWRTGEHVFMTGDAQTVFQGEIAI